MGKRVRRMPYFHVHVAVQAGLSEAARPGGRQDVRGIAPSTARGERAAHVPLFGALLWSRRLEQLELRVTAIFMRMQPIEYGVSSIRVHDGSA